MVARQISSPFLRFLVSGGVNTLGTYLLYLALLVLLPYWLSYAIAFVSGIALAYVLSTSMNVFPLVGCRTPAEFEENAAAVSNRLSPTEVAWLDLETDEVPG